MKMAADTTLELAARDAFANYVQSVAFNLTLSRSMIGMLQIIRDAPPSTDIYRDDAKWRNTVALRKSVDRRVDSHWVPLAHAVQRRGLVIHCPLPEGKKFHECPGHQFYRLTRAGELVCELLVEAGILPAKEPARMKKRKAA